MGFIEDALGGIGDGIGDIVDSVGDAIEDVVDGIGDVVSDAVDMVGGFIEGIFDDPLNAIAMALSIAFPPFAPLIQAVNTAIHGGDIGDILVSAAAAWAGGQIGQLAGNEVSSAILENFTDVASGPLPAGVSESVFKVARIAQSATTSGVGSTVQQLISTGSIDPTRVLNATITGGVSGGVTALTQNLSWFKDLPSPLKNILTTGLNSGLSAALTGRDVGSVLGTDLVNAALQEGFNYLTDEVKKTDAYKEITAYVKTTAAGQAYDTVSNSYNTLLNNVKSAFTKADTAHDATTAAADKYNAAKAQLDKDFAAYNRGDYSFVYSGVPVDDGYSSWAFLVAMAQDNLKEQAAALKVLGDDFVNKYEISAPLIDSYEKLSEDLTKKYSSVLQAKEDFYVNASTIFDTRFDVDAARAANPTMSTKYANDADFVEAWFTSMKKEIDAGVDDPTIIGNWNDAFVKARTTNNATLWNNLNSKFTETHGYSVYNPLSVVQGELDESNLMALRAKAYDNVEAATQRLTTAYAKLNRGEITRTSAEFQNAINGAQDAYNKLYGTDNPLQITIRGSASSATSAQQDQFAQKLQNFDGEEYGTWFLDAAKRATEWAESTGNSTLQNSVANIIKAGGGLLSSFNGMVVLAGIRPGDTAFGRFAGALEKIGKAGNTAEYQAAIANFKTIWGNSGPGVGGAIKGIWGQFQSAPMEFVAEFIGVEGFQEIAPWLIGGVAAGGAKGAALALKYGEAIATRIGRTAGMTASMASDVMESAGGAADNAYKEAYDVAIKAGKTAAEADQFAMGVAQRTALVAGFATAASFGIGGSALERATLGRTGSGAGFASAIDAMQSFISTGGKITLKEGLSEAGEEGITTAYLESELYRLDPTRDVSKNIAGSSIMGGIAGGPIAGASYAGDRTFEGTGDVLSSVLAGNPTIALALNQATTPQQATTALTSLGITDAAIRNNLLNTRFDAQYTSTGEAQAALAGRTDYSYSAADVLALTRAGATDATLAAKVNEYVDPRVFDAAEATAALKAAYAAAGISTYTPTAAEIAAAIGQGGATYEQTKTAAINTDVDARTITRQEVIDAYKALGYTPNNSEIDQFIGLANESGLSGRLSTYVDPRQMTKDEATAALKAAYADAGFPNHTPTAAEVAAFVGQGANFEATKSTAITSAVDAGTITRQEVIDAYKALGYTPNNNEINQFIAIAAESGLSGRLSTYIDPRQMTTEEATAALKAAYTAAGFPNHTPTAAEVAAYVGQGANFETTKSSAITSAVDAGTITRQEVIDAYKALGYTPNNNEINQFIAIAAESGLSGRLTTYIGPRQMTYEEAERALKTAGISNPTREEINRFVGQGANYESTTNAAIQAWVDPRVTDEQEIRDVFKRFGIDNPTQADIDALKGEFAESQLITRSQPYIDAARHQQLVKLEQDRAQQAKDAEAARARDAEIALQQARDIEAARARDAAAAAEAAKQAEATRAAEAAAAAEAAKQAEAARAADAAKALSQAKSSQVQSMLLGTSGGRGGGAGPASGGVAGALEPAKIQPSNVTPYSASAAEITGQAPIGKVIEESYVRPEEFSFETPPTKSEDEETNMSGYMEGGAIPNTNFGYSEQIRAMAGGGIASLGSSLGGYSDGGQLLRGPGTGLSDNIPATIDKKQPARLAAGEFVVPADVVSALGGGSTESGAKILYEMLDRIRNAAHGKKQQIKKVNPKQVLPR